ncbi:protein kintoun isoform X2 [Folsomia candida]|uniref:protein kintoun isoform X2 n=1 Tax=Folsomia candida TaxID=158441 RepID=UPI000B8FB581|nr:protein kintoun isoform X2 [Folsomia candida]
MFQKFISKIMSGGQEGASTNFETLPTFYPPNDTNAKEDFELTQREFEQIKDALKQEEFRKLLVEYVEEVQDPENQKTYQSEVRQLERQNGNEIHFLNPVPAYVLKTSVDGNKKGFINICANPLIRKATSQKGTNPLEGGDGFVWSIPYAQSPPREDIDKAGAFCFVYDVIFHPFSLRMAEQNLQFRKKIEQISMDGVESSFKVTLDRNNVKKPKLQYKGIPRATVIKYKIGEAPPSVVDPAAIQDEIPPQPLGTNVTQTGTSCKKFTCAKNYKKGDTEMRKKFDSTFKPMSKIDKMLNLDPVVGSGLPEEWTVPRYSYKYRSHVDLQDCAQDNQRSGKSSKPIPDEIIITIDLPLLSDSSTLDADVLDDGWNFELKSTRKANYELKLRLPFQVFPESAKAKFEKDKRKLHVTMKTVQIQKPLEAIMRQLSDDIDVFESDGASEDFHEGHTRRLVEEIKAKVSEADVGYESTESNENIPTVINGNIVVKSILKGSSNNIRCRSKSESWIDHMDHLQKEDFALSLESLSESNELLTLSESSGSPNENKSVRFSDRIQQKIYRSNSSILGQRKKNQRKNKNKRKNRERHNSEGSASSFDEDHEPFHHQQSSSSRSADAGGELSCGFKKNKKPCKSMSLE